MRRYADVVLNSQGVPQTTATVTVTKAATPAGSGAVATIYSDDGITPIANPVSTDSNGRFAFYVADGRYDLKAQLNSGANYIVADQDISSLTEASLLNTELIVDTKRYGTDIFAGANTASVAASPKGRVVIPPGTYSTSTTLNCQDNVPIFAYGVKVTYTGTGTAMKCANMGHGGISGIQLVGPGTGGSTIGLQVGTCAGGLGIDTVYNTFNDITINNFNKGFVMDGCLNNGTYSNRIANMNNTSNNINFYLVPTTANYCNFNQFYEIDSVTSVSHGFQIDGANGNSFFGARAEASGGWGFNFSGVSATTGNSIFGIWGENSTSGDVNCGNAANVTQTTVWGGKAISSPNFAANCFAGPGNVLQVSGTYNLFASGISPFTYNWNSGLGAAFAFVLQNNEGAPTFNNVFAVNRTGSGAGNGAGQLYAGTIEYPLTPRGPIVAGGLTPTITGTGACATITTQAGGYSAGTFKCTAATAASTVTITPGVTATNGWNCTVQDETTRANLFQQTSHNGTTATLTATSITQNDVFTFTCVGF